MYVQELMVDPWTEGPRCQSLCLASPQPADLSGGLLEVLSVMGCCREHPKMSITSSVLWELPVSQRERPDRWVPKVME